MGRLRSVASGIRERLRGALAERAERKRRHQEACAEAAAAKKMWDVPGLDDAAYAAIMGGNAQRLFGFRSLVEA